MKQEEESLIQLILFGSISKKKKFQKKKKKKKKTDQQNAFPTISRVPQFFKFHYMSCSWSHNFNLYFLLDMANFSHHLLLSSLKNLSL